MNYLLKTCQKSSYGGCIHKGGVSTVCSAVYIRREKERDKCEESGRTVSRSTNHHGLLLDKYKSIYTNDEAFGLAGQIAPLTHSNINRDPEMPIKL